MNLRNYKNILCGILVSLALVSTGAYAQMGGSPSSSQSNSDRSSSKSKGGEKHYPNSARVEPKNDMKESDSKPLQKGIDALNDGDDAKAKEDMQKILESSKSKYAQGVALQALANIAFNAQDYKGAIDNYKKLIELNSLNNDGHFDSMFNLVNAYVANEQYQAALDELKIWREQGKREMADAYALEGNIDYRLEKYSDAVAAIKKAQSMTDKPKDSWNSILMASLSASGKSGEASGVVEQQLAKDPNNKKLIHDALVVYVQGGQNDKAAALIEREHSQGLLTDEADYKLGAQLYGQADKPEKGAALLKEGFDKGVVKPSYEMYKLLGDSYALSQNDKSAIDAYAKASPLAKDGYVDYVRGNLLVQNDRSREAVDVLKQAIAKGGLKQPGQAYILLGDAYNQIDSMGEARAAWQKARAYPDSQKMADQRLGAGGQVKIKKKN